MIGLMIGRFALQPSGAVCNLNTCLFRALSLTAQQNTVVVERCWEIPLSKEGRPPRLYGRRHKIYRLVEDTKHLSQDKMKLLLTQTVPKLGGRGDTVFVKKSVGRNKLLPQGLAVYPSPENIEMFNNEKRTLREGKLEDRLQTRTGELTVRFLKQVKLEIAIPNSIQFQLTKEIVCRNFLRKLGVVVPTDALTLPEEPITELGDYWCEVSVNGLDTVHVPMSVIPFVEPRLRRLLKKQEEEQQQTDPE